MEAIKKLKLGKAPGSDGITAEMLKYGEVVVDWMMWICNPAWEQSKVLEDWRKAIIVPLYKGEGNREECNNYRGISLLSVPGKIYGRILNERMMKITDKSVGDEQGGFWKRRGCVHQIFAMKILAIQRNVPEEVWERRKREYRESKALVKRLVRESKEKADEDFGRKLSAEYV